LLTSVAKSDAAPYKQVLTHGFAVDAQGKKMSKSKGNVVAPQKVMNNLGADVLRLWVAGTDYRGEMSVSDEILKRAADVYRRLRNTARYLLSSLNDFDPNTDLLPWDELLAIDQWAIDHTAEVQQQVIQAYDQYQFHQVYQKMHHFCSVEMGGFYLDISKDRQYTTQANSRARRSGQTAMYHIIEALVRWLAPIVSYTADEIWDLIPGERSQSVQLDVWYDGLQTMSEESQFNRAYWHRLLEARNQVSKALESRRSEGVIGSSLESAVALYCGDELFETLNQLGSELRFVFICSEAIVYPLAHAPDDVLSTDNEQLKLQVSAMTEAKCARCWHYCADVGEHTGHPELCGRCVDNVDGPGEQREFV
jgi:isoleucyl-tRNA synthetase